MREFIDTIISLFRGEFVFFGSPVPVPNQSQQPVQRGGDWPEGDNIAWTDTGWKRSNH